MSRPKTNKELLSSKIRRKKIKSGPVTQVLFDEKARIDALIRSREYLTGFEKRNKAKKEQAIERARQQELELKRERRKQKRSKLQAAMTEVVMQVQESQQKFESSHRYTSQVTEEEQDQETGDCVVKTTTIEISPL